MMTYPEMIFYFDTKVEKNGFCAMLAETNIGKLDIESLDSTSVMVTPRDYKGMISIFSLLTTYDLDGRIKRR